MPPDVVYVVRRCYAHKLWIPYSGWRWPPPRLVQILNMVMCLLNGHDWSPWSIDDMDGPGEWMADDEDSFMPYTIRDSLPGEYGSRICYSHCGALETRWPRGQVPPRFVGRCVVGER